MEPIMFYGQDGNITTGRLMWQNAWARNGCEIVKPDVVFVQMPEETIEEKLEAARLRVFAWIDYRWMIERMIGEFECHVVPEVAERTAAIRVMIDDMYSKVGISADRM